jgi:hypothetical protein
MKNTRKGKGTMKVLTTLISALVLTCFTTAAVAADTAVKSVNCEVEKYL